MSNKFSLALLGTAFVCLALAMPTQAQAPIRVFVSGSGSDSNNCSVAAPCRTFQGAYSAVAAGGEIDVLDPAGYGDLTIGKALSIQGHGYGGITATGSAGITISAGSSDAINLRGLIIDGAGSSSNGIYFTSGGTLNIQDCVVRNIYTGVWIYTGGSSQLFMSDTIVSDIGAGAITVNAGTPPVTLYLNDVEADNSYSGVSAYGSGAFIDIRNSSISGNSYGLYANDGAVIHLSASNLTGNFRGWTIDTGGGSIESTGDNLIDDNSNDNGAPPTFNYQ